MQNQLGYVILYAGKNAERVELPMKKPQYKPYIYGMLAGFGAISLSVLFFFALYRIQAVGEILDKITQILGLPAGSTTPDGKYSLEATRCIGACGLAPVLTINNEVYGRLVPSDMEGILEKYK